METYQEFLDRINSFEKKELSFGNEYFKGNPSILQKVDQNNRFRDFYGDTVVFSLEDQVKDELEKYVNSLYYSAPECFCERLDSSTFHMTLHDLSSSAMLGDIAEESFENELNVMEKITEIQKYNITKIKMRSHYIFNMVNTSLVLGLYPVDAQEYHKLMKLYSVFDSVKKLNYPLTPHITLAYYNSHGFDLRAARKLEDVVSQLNDREVKIDINIEHLYYQKFKSMNYYINIVELKIKNETGFEKTKQN